MSDNRRHYFLKLLTNVVKIPVFFLLESFFSRILGPKAYGNYNFLNDSLSKIVGFFDSGISMGFYTKFSSNTKDLKLLKSFWFIVFLFSVIFLLFIACSSLFRFNKVIWPEQHLLYIYLSAIFSLMTFYTVICSKILDATRLTILSEKMRMIQMLISILVFVFIFFFLTSLSLDQFYLIQIILLSLLVFGTAIIMNRSEMSLIPKVHLNTADLKKYLKNFYIYSKPFFIYSLFTTLFGLYERWLLQYYSGSIEQAYIGLALKVGSIIFIFSSAMIPILLREISISFGENDIKRINHLFYKNYKILFLLASVISCIIFFNAKTVVLLLGGSEYINSVDVVKVLSIFPVYQTIGQINSSLYYTTNRVKLYSTISIAILPISTLFNYFLIAPKIGNGLELGAIGLALQMVLSQILVQNILLYFNTKFLNLSFYKLLLTQVIVLSIFFLIGYIVQHLLTLVLLNSVLELSVFSFALILGTSFIVYFNPAFLGFENRKEIFNLFK